MTVSTETLRILEPAPGLFAYYDGRVPGRRLHGPGANWLDDGAFVLGTASYALADGEEALVYDTHMSLAHARAIRSHLEARGVRRITVALSHWHCDHVAGNAVFADCPILALRLTAERLEANRAALEADDPPIRPLVMPTRMVEHGLDLVVGRRPVQLRHIDAHSRDGFVAVLPDNGLLLAGDTLEDPITYVTEPERLAAHLRGYDALEALGARRILPNHGAPGRIAAGGYPPALIAANRRYVRWLIDPAGAASTPLAELVRADERAGAVAYFAPYKAVHRRNLEGVAAARSRPPA